MHFTLRQLEFFIALAQTQQISKAASRCHVSQSSMTVAMQNLEQSLNSQLFQRIPKGIKLTASGERFLQHALKIVSQSHIAMEDLLYQPQRIQGTVTIGLAKTVSAYLFPSIIADIENHFPFLEIIWREDDPAILLALLQQQKLDFCLLLTSNIAPDPTLRIETLLRSPRRLWAAAGHPLLSRDTLRLVDLARVPFLLLDTDEYPDTMQTYWQQHGVEPHVVFSTTSFEAIRSLVAKGKGVTVLSDLVYRPWSLEGLRVMRRSIEDTITYMDVGSASLKNTPLSEAAQAVSGNISTLVQRLANDI